VGARHGVRAVLVVSAVFLLILAALSRGARLANAEALLSDEPEWIAISILHWRQSVLGEPPAGAELDPHEERYGTPWRRGVHRTTFGYMYPGLPKWILGGVLSAAGHREARPEVFTILGRGDPPRMLAARVELLPAVPLTRRVVLVTAALACTCFVFAVRRLRDGSAGWVLALVCGALLVSSPLVRNTSTYIRTDWFMMLPALASLWWALRRQGELAGERGRAGQLQVGASLGLLSGLAVSSKLNGAMVGLCVAAWLVLAWLGRRDARTTAEFVRGPLCASLLAGAVCALVFYAFNPRLWSEPLEGVRDILARWDALLRYFQDEVAPGDGVEVARSVPERLALFLDRTTGRDDAWRALTGLPGGTLLAALGLGTLAWRARGLGRGDSGARCAAMALGYCCVTLAVTALWIPLDWERFYLTAAPPMALLQGCALLLVAETLRTRWVRRSTSS
jgi:hypothetical protein